MDLRAVMRAISCRGCGATPGGWCLSASGGGAGRFHAERRQDAAAMSPAKQAAAVAQVAANRRTAIEALDTNLTVEQRSARDAVTARWDRILEETR